jgi:hypothetical protein
VEYVDPVLLLMLVALVCLGICAWRSPRFLRNLAAYMLAQADLIEVCERARRERPIYWRKKLGVETDMRGARIELDREQLSPSELNVRQ